MSREASTTISTTTLSSDNDPGHTTETADYFVPPNILLPPLNAAHPVMLASPDAIADPGLGSHWSWLLSQVSAGYQATEHSSPTGGGQVTAPVGLEGSASVSAFSPLNSAASPDVATQASAILDAATVAPTPESSGNVTSFALSPETVTVSGSGLTFRNTYTANVTSQYRNAIVAAEQDLERHWVNSFAINATFDAQASGPANVLASNSYTLQEGISYATLRSALGHGTSADAQAAFAALPASDPSGGIGWSLPTAYARFLGLTQSAPATDDTVTLYTSYNWTYGQDVIATVEHELSEGAMGRVGALGKNTDNGGHTLWSPMDLFRYSAGGVRDYTDGQDGQASFFSVNGSQLRLQYNNQYNGSFRINNGDTADFVVSDVFGTGSPGDNRTLSGTDLQVMNVLGWTPAPMSTPLFVAAGDFAGTGQAGLLYVSGGNATIALRSGNGYSGQTVPSAHMGSEWTPFGGTGDFNGDGRADILWSNAAGQAAIWEMNGAQLTGFGVPAGKMGADWHVAGVADFNGDGDADILWQSNGGNAAVWSMSGTNLAGFGVPNGHMGQEWHIAGVGDFNGDGNADALWASNSGQVSDWLLDGANLTGFNGSIGAMGTEWHVAGIGDVNGDKTADIVWVDRNNDVQVWDMAGGNIGQIVNPAGRDGLEWQCGGVADFTGDGRADLLWLNGNGSSQIWQIQGTQVAVISGSTIV